MRSSKTGSSWNEDSFLQQGPLPRFFYFRHDSTILKPQFSGTSAWAGLGGLTGVNMFVLAMWNGSGNDQQQEWMMENFTTDITNVAEGRVWSLATASISHMDRMHFLGNMFAMWLFGFPLYRVLGTTAFYGLYLAGGVSCSATHVVHNMLTGRTQPPLTKQERDRLEEFAQVHGVQDLPQEAKRRIATADKPALGASGSVMAISAASAALFPLDRVRMSPTAAFYLPLPVAVGLFVSSDLMGLTMEGSPVDHAGHLGGLAMGAAYVTAAWYSKRGSFRILHSLGTGGELPIVYRFRQMLRSI